jgi:hypothetical protein
MARFLPPRRESSGAAYIALDAEPYRSIKLLNVAGPTFSLRINRNQSRCSVRERWRCSISIMAGRYQIKKLGRVIFCVRFIRR